MPRWFTRTKQTHSQSPENRPQPFEVRCECGQLHAGVRQRLHQMIECTACGAEVFVLPADVYPVFEPPRTKGRKNKKKRRRSVPVKSAPSEPLSRSEQIPAEPLFDTEEEIPVAPEVAAEEPAPAASVLSVPEVKRSPVTPLRVVLAAMAVVVLLTIWIVVRARNLDRAANVALTARQQGDVALAQGDIGQAASHYRQADEAFAVLGRSDEPALQARQLARETAAATQLAVRPLLDIIEDAHREVTAAQSDEARLKAESHALDRYAEQWLVMEATLKPAADGESPRWVIDFPLAIDGLPIELSGDLPAFEPLKSAGQPARVLFAAQPARCRLIQAPRRALVIDFNSETAFLWRNFETLQHTELAGDDELAVEAVRALLARQAQLPEVQP